MHSFSHPYAFDPACGMDIDGLLAVTPPAEPADFADFWQEKYRLARQIDPTPELILLTGDAPAGFVKYQVSFCSTEHLQIHGWLYIPEVREVARAFIMGHGYADLSEADPDLRYQDAAYLFHSFRGLGLSRTPDISDNPAYHVLHDIDKPDRYILGGCVEDLWLAVSVMEKLYPHFPVNYIGISFGGGIGALAIPWDARIRRAHLNVPTFGHHPLRLELPTLGSAAAVQQYQLQHGNVMETLRYYDAAVAARHIRIPMHIACALFDPMVAPPGQFAIYNALPGNKELFVLKAGHFDYPDKANEYLKLQESLNTFFGI